MAKKEGAAQRPESTHADDEPAMKVEWQVVPGDGRTFYILHSEESVRKFLAAKHATFVADWTPDQTCVLHIEVRRAPCRARGGEVVTIRATRVRATEE